MEFPNYQGGGILNLMSSLALGLGGPGTGHAPLDLLPRERVARARQVLLLIIDGLGHDYLLSRAPQGPLRQGLAGRISTVAPSTTAAAITSFLTGQPPARHGFTGWFTWLRELGCVTTILPFVTRHGGLPLGETGPGPGELSGAGPLFDPLPVECHAVCPDYIATSLYTRAFAGKARIHAYGNLGEFLNRVAGLLRAPGERRYVYAYWPQLDHLAHEHGIGGTAVAHHFTELDAAFGRLLDALAGTDTLVVASADHGFVDSPPDRQIHLADHPELARCLTLPLCGEPRCTFCYVHPRHKGRFEDYVNTHLDAQTQCFPSHDLLERGLFGPGVPDPRVEERIGDYVLVMRDNYLLKDRLPSEKPYHHLGVHGGLSAAELYVPLILAEV